MGKTLVMRSAPVPGQLNGYTGNKDGRHLLSGVVLERSSQSHQD